MIKNVGCAMVALLTMAGQLTAQKSDKKETVVVLGADSLSAHDIRAELFIRPGFRPLAVIKVRRDATEEDLADSFAEISKANRMLKGRRDQPAGNVLRMVLEPGKSRRELTREERKSYAAYLKSLDKAPAVDVPGVGKGKAVEIWMPSW